MNYSFTKQTITFQLAQKMINAAFTKASEIGFGISVTIVDESGINKLFARMDTANIMSIDVSRKKASNVLTAIGMQMPTGDSWYNFIKDDPILLNGVSQIKDFTLLGGGAPIVVGDEIIGAIGVSGGHYKQDEECMKAALEAIVSE